MHTVNPTEQNKNGERLGLMRVIVKFIKLKDVMCTRFPQWSTEPHVSTHGSQHVESEATGYKKVNKSWP